MSAGETIGVDLGGTKMLVGALAGTEILWESREASTGQTEEALVDLLVREVERGAPGSARRRRRRPRDPGDDQP